LSRENKVWLIGAGAAIILGSLLPWVSAGIISLSGTEGDGVFTLIMGGVIAIVGFVGKSSKSVAVAVVTMAIVSGLIVFNVMTNLADVDPTEFLAPRPGGGLWIAGAGALAAFGAGVKTWNEASVQAATRDATHGLDQ